MQVLDTALVNIVAGRPRIRVRPRRPEDARSAKAMQACLNYYVDEDHLVEKQPVFVQQGLIYGVTAAKNHWLYRKSDRQVPDVQVDPLTGVVQRRLVTREVVDRDGPTFEPWDMYDMWWDPAARSVDTAQYVVLRSWMTRAELEAQRYDPESQAGLYQNLDLLYSSSSRQKPDTAQNRLLDSGAPSAYKDRFEVWEVWRDDRLTVIGNRKVLLRDVPNPYWHGRIPIVVAQSRPDVFRVEGISETELVDHLQQALWTVHNLRTDNMKMTVQRGFTYREGGVTDPNSLVYRPRFKWPVTDHDDVQFAAPPPLPAEAYNEDEILLRRLQYVTGITPAVSGADLQSMDQSTATAAAVYTETAGRLLKFKAQQLQTKGFQRSFEMWAEMTKQFMDRDLAVQVAGADGEVWERYTPQDVVGSYDIKVEGEEESLSRQQERSEAVQLLNAVGPLAQAGLVNLRPVIERVAVAFNMDNVEALFAPAQPQGQPPVAAPGPNGGAPGPNNGGVFPLVQQPSLPNGMPMPQQPALAIGAR